MRSPIFWRNLLLATAVLAAMVPLPALTAADDTITPIARPKRGDFVFQLLPKAFQRTPDLDMTIFTEVTSYGRLMRTPNPAEPMYYVAHSMGYKPRGDTVAGDHPPSPEQVSRALAKALTTNGYRNVEGSGQRPTLAIIYFWGSHYRLDPEMEAMFPEQARIFRMERAKLVGGRAQLEKMTRALAWGESLTDRTADYEFLRDQALDDLYYVVASAYDYAALAHNERRLVWRTTMTVSSRGVAMQESIGPLVSAAAPYFGRDMQDPQIATHRIKRWEVRLGDSKVIESDVPTPAKPKTK
ncbi:hypothetical protein [Opitutus sp. ER46]|uniref:hypothetical protein n=1 Tax=Opitutus sp. ER46 TaxID=2161864 RepID=UPI000D2FD579|nr:hypothetical protein [Opitutus sp. ER46]PTX92654.1 hypothetical protein DB354_15120 [Opitutus sp. ER46]